MTIVALLVVVALVQSVFLAGIVVLLLVNRSRSSRRRRRNDEIGARIEGTLQRWLVGDGSVSDVATRLASLSDDEALTHTAIIATSRAAPTRRAELAEAIRHAPWVKRVLARARSRNWWRRLDAARLLAIVGNAADRDLLHLLLNDPHPAVQGIAAAALPAVNDLDAVVQVLEALPERSPVVQLFHFSMLRECWWLATPALVERLVPESRAPALETWINLAEVIGTAEVLDRACALRRHPDPLVRLAVSRAVKRYFHPAATEALHELLRDPDWRVRAGAARSIGVLGDVASVPLLALGMHDGQWWVRFRSALALAQLGERGRAALREARESTDRYAAEMAMMVNGLSPGSVVELSEA